MALHGRHLVQHTALHGQHLVQHTALHGRHRVGRMALLDQRQLQLMVAPGQRPLLMAVLQEQHLRRTLVDAQYRAHMEVLREQRRPAMARLGLHLLMGDPPTARRGQEPLWNLRRQNSFL